MDADQAWIERTPEGRIGFVPAASGSVDYGEHLATYLREAFEREVDTIPVYRSRDARRGRNLDRVRECAAIYLGGGVPDQLLEAVQETPFTEALLSRLRQGGTVVAIAAAAQALGAWARSLFGGGSIAGLQWLRGGVVEPNFDPEHDHRFRQLMREPGVRWGLGLPAGSAVLLGPEGETEVVGVAYLLESPDGELHRLGEEDFDGDSM
jgi:cyanophycinase-like exopeptidase